MDGIIFDVDGTLIDIMNFRILVEKKLKEQGISYTEEDLDAYMLAISYMREISSGVLVEEIADKLDASSFTLKEVIISLIREFSLKGEEVYHSFINKSKIDIPPVILPRIIL